MPIILALLAVCIPLTACEALSPTGPLDLSDTGGTWCGDYPLYVTSSMGVNIPSDLSSDITITDVWLNDASNMTLDGAWLMQHRDGGLLAGFGRFPLSEDTFPDWADAVPAIGAVVHPGDRADLVLKLLSGPDMPARMSGVHIVYTAGGWEHVTDSHSGAGVGEC
ncbi:hypothetical protein [Glaciihabitans sp. dw_435]|uniref:hypothetical protein n=1 Tax=Glaciihabitans sp. dw_435 TaxID=2720081 RepID=UPI001BD2B685|nr:hypothetical protein [Glaciihabitans sp. dw_435]